MLRILTAAEIMYIFCRYSSLLRAKVKKSPSQNYPELVFKMLTMQRINKPRIDPNLTLGYVLCSKEDGIAVVDLGGPVVIILPLDPKFAGLNPGGVDGLFRT